MPESLASYALRRQCCIPILPHRFVAKLPDQIGYLVRRALIGDLELAGGVGGAVVGGGPFAGAQLDDPAVFGVMQLLLAGAGIAAWLSMTAALINVMPSGISPLRSLATHASRGRGRHPEHQAKGAHQLHELAVAQMCQGLKLTSAGTQPGQGNSQLRLPAIAEQVSGMGRNADGFQPPVAQAEERANANAAKPRRVGPLGRFQAPLKVRFGPAVCMAV